MTKVQLPVMASVRSSSTSERVKPSRVAMEPKLRMRRGVLSESHEDQLHVWFVVLDLSLFSFVWPMSAAFTFSD